MIMSAQVDADLCSCDHTDSQKTDDVISFENNSALKFGRERHRLIEKSVISDLLGSVSS